MFRHYLYEIVVPVFFVLFSIAYTPFEILEKMNLGVFSPQIHIVFLGCIILVTMLLSRTSMFLAGYKLHIKPMHELLWYSAEMILSAVFMALYISLFKGELYFNSLGTAITLQFGICLFPYAILFLSFALADATDPYNKANLQDKTIKFTDEHKRTKLIIDPASIIYIKADDNLIQINYLESGHLRVYPVRTSMRSIEEMVHRNGMQRCHRSYYINPKYVKVLRKGSDGLIYADVNNTDISPIPVSKKYYNILADLL